MDNSTMGVTHQRIKEHGIEEARMFKVGDWVVVGEDRVLAQFVGHVHKGTQAELPQIDIKGQLYSSHFGAWKHATPKEIAAGQGELDL